MHGNEDNEGIDREGTEHGNGGNVSDFSLNLHFDMKHNNNKNSYIASI